jgi:hypothetical protein
LDCVEALASITYHLSLLAAEGKLHRSVEAANQSVASTIGAVK